MASNALRLLAERYSRAGIATPEPGRCNAVPAKVFPSDQVNTVIFGNATPKTPATPTIEQVGVDAEMAGEFEEIGQVAIEVAYCAAERAAIIAEGEHGNPLAHVPHTMPPSWAEPLIEPTPGAICRNCNGRSWWCEAISPNGWRCSRCHPDDHLPAYRRREVRT